MQETERNRADDPLMSLTAPITSVHWAEFITIGKYLVFPSDKSYNKFHLGKIHAIHQYSWIKFSMKVHKDSLCLVTFHTLTVLKDNKSYRKFNQKN